MGRLLGRQIVAGYSISVGFAILLSWILILVIGELPQVFERPSELTFHAIAEVLSGILLIISGAGLIFSESGWAPRLSLLSLGMLLYAAVNAIGVYAQVGNMILVVLLIIVILSTIAVIALPPPRDRQTYQKLSHL